MAGGLVSPVFAGREAELALLASAFEDAAGGTPRTVLVGAEAGGGKSRLVGEFAGTVRDRALVLTGSCVELSAGGLPYAPFTAVLRQLARLRGAVGVAALLPGQGSGELGVLLPEFGPAPAGADPETPVPGYSRCSSPCSRPWPNSARWSWSSRTCNGPTAGPVTC